MAGEILINDGGAPARILPFVSGAVFEAGQCAKIATDGELELCTDKDLPIAGVLLTDAVVGGMANMVSGSGVILNVKCAAAVNRGDPLMTNEAAPGELIIWAKADDSICVGYALEDAGGGTATRGLTKVLVS